MRALKYIGRSLMHSIIVGVLTLIVAIVAADQINTQEAAIWLFFISAFMVPGVAILVFLVSLLFCGKRFDRGE